MGREHETEANSPARTLRAAGRCAEQGGDRYEFRVFRPRLGAEAAILASVAGAGQFHASVDRYVVVPDRPDVGLKLRGGRVELKVLSEICTGLQRWHPQGSVTLPASGRALADLLGSIGLAPPPAGRLFPDADALAAWFAGERGLTVVTLRKRRRRYLDAHARAETGTVVWNGKRIETLAVEGTDAGAVAALVARLGLADAANTGYPRLLSEGISA